MQVPAGLWRHGIPTGIADGLHVPSEPHAYAKHSSAAPFRHSSSVTQRSHAPSAVHTPVEQMPPTAAGDSHFPATHVHARWHSSDRGGHSASHAHDPSGLGPSSDPHALNGHTLTPLTISPRYGQHTFSPFSSGMHAVSLEHSASAAHGGISGGAPSPLQPRAPKTDASRAARRKASGFTTWKVRRGRRAARCAPVQ